MLKIQVTNRKTKQTKNYRFTQHAVIFGRQQNCDVALESSSISRRHAKISVNKELVEIEDLGSGNGTLVNQKKIPAREKTPLKPEDEIRIEEYDIKFQLETEKNQLEEMTQPAPKPPPSLSSPSPVLNTTETTDPDILEIKMIKKVLGALDHEKLPSLTVISEPFKNKKVVFDENMKKLIIGREAGCHLSLDASVVSRQHAFIALKWGGYVVKDMDSKNGTFVNSERVEEKSLKDGDEIVFGTIKCLFKNPQEFDIQTITRSLEEHKKLQNQEKEKIEPKEEPKTDVKPEIPSKEPEEKPKTSPEQKPPKPAPFTLFKQFSPLELGLFGFGALVIVVVIVFLFKLLAK